jgi:hypothetical protein
MTGHDPYGNAYRWNYVYKLHTIDYMKVRYVFDFEKRGQLPVHTHIWCVKEASAAQPEIL